jgi:hypothetical protein
VYAVLRLGARARLHPTRITTESVSPTNEHFSMIVFFQVHLLDDASKNGRQDRVCTLVSLEWMHLLLRMCFKESHVDRGKLNVIG